MNLTKENIMEHVDVDPITGCWEWKHAQNGKGYGLIGNHRKRRVAHRVVWELFFGLIPDDLFCCHHCDNPSCVNPRHLFLGTPKDNLQDAAKKGRMASGARNGAYTHPERRPRGKRNGHYTKPENTPRGEDIKTGKLTIAQVIEIRKSYVAGGVTQRSLARRYGIKQSGIWCILHRRSWSHV